jgi:hypothetical protein
MKNLHVLPTDKPSRLYKSKITQITHIFMSNAISQHGDATYNLNIYITSDEEIKPNTYCLINRVLCKTELLNNKIVSRQLTGGATMDICKSEYLEIILTTDQDLIKDGVQSIDDEFLEWFVENPSCEYVDLDTFSLGNKILFNVVFPKEEPKQIKCYCGHTTYCDCGPLEEASWKYNPLKKLDGEFLRQAFKEGAKWQTERMYSEEDIREAYFSAIKITGEGWNGEYAGGNSPNIEDKFSKEFKEWFEQFKKNGGDKC